MEDIKNLLSQVTRLYEKRQIEQNKKMHDGEMFNIFSVCKLRYDELKHSAIIAEILNPQGIHGQKTDFLEIFIDVLKKKVGNNGMKFDAEEIFSEKKDVITVVTELSTDKGRLDIVVKHGRIPFLIVENKLYAQDQHEQLIRYKKYAERYSDRFELVYLSLNGKEASEYSANGVRYIRLSYSDDIVQWLDRCIEKCDKSPIIEILKQYKTYVEQITYKNMENKDNLFEIMAENCEAAMNIASDMWGFREYLIKRFESEMEKELREGKLKDFELKYTRSENDNFAFSVRNNNWKKRAEIYFGNEESGKADRNYYGIWCDKVKPQEQPLTCLNGDAPNDYWPFGSVYMEKYKDWSHWNKEFMMGLANGDFMKYIMEKIEEIVFELKRENINLSESL